MNSEWWNWRPQYSTEHEDVTSEDFSVNLWNLHDSKSLTELPTNTNVEPSVVDLNFELAPSSLRDAWTDEDYDVFNPSLPAKTKSPFSFMRMEQTKNSDVPSEGTPKKSLANLCDGSTDDVTVSTPHSANITPPIGSEMKALKGCSNGPSHKSTGSAVPASLSPRNMIAAGAEEKETRHARSLSNSSGGVELPDEADDASVAGVSRETSPQSSVSTASTVTITPSRMALAGSTPAISRAAGAAIAPTMPWLMAPSSALGTRSSSAGLPPKPPVSVMAHRISAEDMAAMHSHSVHHAQTTLTQDFQRQFEAMRAQFQTQLRMKDQLLFAQDKALHQQTARAESANANLKELFGCVQKYQERVKHHFNPTNQAVFQESATNANLIPRPSANPLDIGTPPQQIDVPQVLLPANTYPGAYHPQQSTCDGVAPHTPEFVANPVLVSPTTPVAAVVEGKGKRNARIEPLFHLTANKDDDVFVDNDLGPGLRYFFSTTGYEQKGMTEAFTSFFSKVEAAVRTTPMIQITKRPQADVNTRDLLRRCGEHILHHGEAHKILEHKDEKFFMITGILNRAIVNHVFYEGLVTDFQCKYQQQINHFWHQEWDVYYTDVENISLRKMLGKNRAEGANLIEQLPGFWDFVDSATEVVLNRVIPYVAAAFHNRCLPAFRIKLQQAVYEALCLAIRIRQDPRYYEFHFLNVGSVWDSRFMVHRNAELVGKELPDERTPYIARCTSRPLIKVKNFDTGELPLVFYKAEILVSGQKGKLRPYLRAGRFHRR